MQLPYAPRAVHHKHGGTILEVVRVDHHKARPRDGLSRDTWHFVGRVQWDDGSGAPNKLYEIAPYMLCADTDEGCAEIGALCDVMNAYLNERGDWLDGKPYEGWYAHRP